MTHVWCLTTNNPSGQCVRFPLNDLPKQRSAPLLFTTSSALSTPLKREEKCLFRPNLPCITSPVLSVRGLPSFCPALVHSSTIVLPVLPVCADFKRSWRRVFFASLESSRSKWKTHTTGCAQEQNILMCRREVDDVTADKGCAAAVTGSVHNGSTFNPFYKPLMNMAEVRRDESDPSSLEGTWNTWCPLFGSARTRRGINHGRLTVTAALKLRNSRCCSAALWNRVCHMFPPSRCRTRAHPESWAPSLFLQFQYLW